MLVPRYYEYLPKKVHDTRNAVCTKLFTDYASANPGLEIENVTVKFILMRCNFAMEHRGDVEDHTYYTNMNNTSRSGPFSNQKNHIIVLCSG